MSLLNKNYYFFVQNPDLSFDETNLCFRYWPEDKQWKPIAMAHNRTSSASVLVNNGREMWIIGGNGGYDPDSTGTSEILNIDTGLVRPGPGMVIIKFLSELPSCKEDLNQVS